MTRIFRFALVLALAGVSLSAQRAPIQQQLAFAPYHASGIYNIGETVGWTVTAGPTPPSYAYKWTIRRNNAVVLKEGKLDLSSGRDRIEIVGDQPEMIYVAIEAYAGPLSRLVARRLSALTHGSHFAFFVLAAISAASRGASLLGGTDVLAR